MGILFHLRCSEVFVSVIVTISDFHLKMTIFLFTAFKARWKDEDSVLN